MGINFISLKEMVPASGRGGGHGKVNHAISLVTHMVGPKIDDWELIKVDQ